jgi:hypothetical protein
MRNFLSWFVFARWFVLPLSSLASLPLLMRLQIKEEQLWRRTSRVELGALSFSK